MSDESLSKEQRILRTLRKVLGNIVKDTTPARGMPHPLQEGTIHSIRELFGLIAAREAELAEETGLTRNERPHYTDEPPRTQFVRFHKPEKKPN
ncbi:MAG: segregation and condensation protein A [Betaproteobacteria bacterium]|nr:segregation and condensation protein A [Betaproteobacteria bacterium]